MASKINKTGGKLLIWIGSLLCEVTLQFLVTVLSPLGQQAQVNTPAPWLCMFLEPRKRLIVVVIFWVWNLIVLISMTTMILFGPSVLLVFILEVLIRPSAYRKRREEKALFINLFIYVLYLFEWLYSISISHQHRDCWVSPK